MDVYLVPLGRQRFEVYYEAAEDSAVAPLEPRGFFGRLRTRFAAQLRDAEHARLHATAERHATLTRRLQQKMMRWIAERVASQRLLWNLRTADVALLHAPDTLAPAEAERILRANLQGEVDRHLRLLGIHSIGLLLSAPVMLLPGPNAIGYFFTFTVVGHFLAWRGARRGLRAVKWTVSSSSELTEISHALALGDRDSRHRWIHDVAGRLHLPRLATHLERMAAPTA